MSNFSHTSKEQGNSGGVAVELLKALVKTPVETLVKTPEAILQALKEDSSLTLAEVADRIGKSVSAVERAAKKLRRACPKR